MYLSAVRVLKLQNVLIPLFSVEKPFYCRLEVKGGARLHYSQGKVTCLQLQAKVTDGFKSHITHTLMIWNLLRLTQISLYEILYRINNILVCDASTASQWQDNVSVRQLHFRPSIKPNKLSLLNSRITLTMLLPTDVFLKGALSFLLSCLATLQPSWPHLRAVQDQAPI